MSLNLSLLIEASAKMYPNRTAIILDDLVYSFSQLDALAAKFANVLQSLGVERGDKVALMMPNLPGFTIAYFGILKLGATVVPFNVLFKASEVALSAIVRVRQHLVQTLVQTGTSASFEPCFSGVSAPSPDVRDAEVAGSNPVAPTHKPL